jgi:hypothetical protein
VKLLLQGGYVVRDGSDRRVFRISPRNRRPGKPLKCTLSGVFLVRQADFFIVLVSSC